MQGAMCISISLLLESCLLWGGIHICCMQLYGNMKKTPVQLLCPKKPRPDWLGLNSEDGSFQHRAGHRVEPQ